LTDKQLEILRQFCLNAMFGSKNTFKRPSLACQRKPSAVSKPNNAQTVMKNMYTSRQQPKNRRLFPVILLKR